MISQTQTASNQYGFYAVPKKLQPKKKYRDEQYEDIMNDNDDQSNQFHPIPRPTHPEHQIQPDYYINQAPYPEFKPKQSGLDYGVQVLTQQLMDFDLEVTPLLEIIVGRCVVSAINQLQQEKEKQEKKIESQKYRKKRNAQLMVTQRLEAKSKRKHQQSQRRQLQQSIYHKNNRQIHQKIIVRKLAKNKLLNLGNDVIWQLQQNGLLRYQPTLELRIDYEGWLYGEVTKMIEKEQEVTRCVNKMINEVEEDDEQKHKKKIEKEKQRRKEIQNQRQRVKKINEQRREKKRIHKFRLNLNKLRQPLAINFQQLLENSNDIETGVMKHVSIDDGFVANNVQQQSLHVSGGLFQYLLVLLNSTPQVHHTPDELEELIVKIINQLQNPLQIPVNRSVSQFIRQQVEEMERDGNSFMIEKVGRVAQISKKVEINMRLIELTGIQIKPLLHQSLVLALLNIYFTTSKLVSSNSNSKQKQSESSEQKQNSEENQQQSQPKQNKQELRQQQKPTASVYSPTEQDKLRESIRQKLLFRAIDREEKITQLQTVLRVRFERKKQSHTSDSSSQFSQSRQNGQRKKQQINQSNEQLKNQENINPNQHQDESKNQQQGWIDIYDGEGWPRYMSKHPVELERQPQKPSTYPLTGFENSFVYDERVLHYLRLQIERVLQVDGGEDVERYQEGLSNFAKLTGKDIPVIDGELATGE